MELDANLSLRDVRVIDGGANGKRDVAGVNRTMNGQSPYKRILHSFTLLCVEYDAQKQANWPYSASVVREAAPIQFPSPFHYFLLWFILYMYSSSFCCVGDDEGFGRSG